MSLSTKVLARTRPLFGPISLRLTRSLSTSSGPLHTPKSSAGTPADIETHTGQKFDKDDYRLVRFTNKEKQVNTRFAIDLIAEVPPTNVKSRVVSCDGGGGPTGHPKVYINLDAPGNHSCGYCGLRFHKEEHHHHH